MTAFKRHRRDFLKSSFVMVGATDLILSSSASVADAVSEQENVVPLISNDSSTAEITIENAEFRLLIGTNGIARSLVHKATKQECLVQNNTPVFSMKHYGFLPGQLKLAHRAEAKTFPARSVRREGDRLFVAFEVVPHEVTIKLKITDAYVAFVVEEIGYRVRGYRSEDFSEKTPIDEMFFLQLPVRDRKNFGEWLNVMWDDEVAVNVLGTDPYARIDSVAGPGYHLLQAGTVDEVNTLNVGAALITTGAKNLLDRIAQVETDFDLPRGAESRRRDQYKFSYYWAGNVSPESIDQHIAYAAQGGFRLMMLSYFDFARTAGHFPWRSEYPNGAADLAEMVRKIKAAGMAPGLHIHYNKAHKEDPYVSPNPDPRLNLRRLFTLAAPLDLTAATVTVEENPRGCTLDNERRFLKIGHELITYENYTTIPPFQFTGCKRGQLSTKPAAREAGFILGLLDIDTWPIFVRFDQKNGLQKEVAARIADIFKLGFEFAYLDGGEDVPPPYWFFVSWSQWVVHESLNPKLLFAEGAIRTHFSWHVLTRGNAFDTFRPEVIKAATRQYPAEEAPRMAQDLTSLNFGWIGYWAPSTQNVGTQPDMLEYVTSRAAAWDCPVSLWPNLKDLDSHPRTRDNLEVIRKWEEVRARKWLSPVQKEALRDLDQEHTLLVTEKGEFELVPYEQIPDVAGGDSIRAFIFERRGRTEVLYWHTSGQASIEVPISSAGFRLRENNEEVPIRRKSGSVVLPARGKRLLECPGVERGEVIRAFQQAKVIAG